MSTSLGPYRAPSLTSTGPIEIDPAAPGTVMRVALGLEALANIPLGAMSLFTPAAFLNLLAPDPSAITPLAEMCSRFYGVTIIGLTAPMILGVFNNRTAIESRPYSYLMLGTMEVGMLATAAWVVSGPGDSSGFTTEAMKSILRQIGPFLCWRLYVFFQKPQWFGRYREVKKGL